MGKTPRLAFRRMTLDDVDAVTALDLKSFGRRDAWSREDFLCVERDPDAENLIAERDGKIVGFAGAMINSDTAEIETFAVAPDCHRQGIGTLLLTKLICNLIIRGVTFVVLEVRPSNAAAIKLYENFGFRIVEREENFYLDEDAWVMAREI